MLTYVSVICASSYTFSRSALARAPNVRSPSPYATSGKRLDITLETRP